jgi:hypothetical protein
MVKQKKTEVEQEEVSKRNAQEIKNLLKANEYLYPKYPSLKESIEKENEQLNKELEELGE